MALTTVQLGMQGSPQFYGFKNRIINGGMVISQRGTGSIAVDNGNWYYPADRFAAYQSIASSKYTIQQNAGSVTPPTGFNYYIGATVTSAYSPTGTDWFPIRQTIEGYNVADLLFGTANAKTFTVSFWVRSSLTGTMGGAFWNNDGSRTYPFTYTISAANTWEQKTITVAGDTTGTWNATNLGGLTITWSLGAGSTYKGTAGAWAGTFYTSATGATDIVATNGATLYITGVQLEKGVTATDFDFLDYGRLLQQCQRYYFQINGNNSGNTTLGMGFANGGSESYAYMKYPTTMRSTPTISGSSGLRVSDLNSYTITGTSASVNAGDVNGMNIYISTGGGLTTLRPSNNLLTNSTTAYIGFTSEL